MATVQHCVLQIGYWRKCTRRIVPCQRSGRVYSRARDAKNKHDRRAFGSVAVQYCACLFWGVCGFVAFPIRSRPQPQYSASDRVATRSSSCLRQVSPHTARSIPLLSPPPDVGLRGEKIALWECKYGPESKSQREFSLAKPSLCLETSSFVFPTRGSSRILEAH